MAFLEREEHDACGIVAWVEKGAQPTRANVERVLRALDQMKHRAGFVEEEGDGSGILVDLPRAIWVKKLGGDVVARQLVANPLFAVAHVLLTDEMKSSEGIAVDVETVAQNVPLMAEAAGFSLCKVVIDPVHAEALGPGGRKEGIHFLQFAFLYNDATATAERVDAACYRLLKEIETQLRVHVASLSSQSTVYKIRGDSDTLRAYYTDLNDESFVSRITIGHNRYSTNTTTSSERVQPFTLLGHNGELNTIHRLREESRMVNIETVSGGSDSQDLDRFLEGLIHNYSYSLIEAMEIAFPPIIHEIKQMSLPLQDLYMYIRSLFGPFAQGPAGIVSRHGREAVFSVDAMGLRPLWMVETDASLIFSSEQGVVSLSEMIHDPRPLSPGEKIYLELPPGEPTIVHAYPDAQHLVHARMRERHEIKGYGQGVSFHGPLVWGDTHLTPNRATDGTREARMAVFGWDQEDVRNLEAQTANGAEPIRSLGFDGPLAALSAERQNLSDYLKETVAVVTNPAVDREREIEHFSTRVVLGGRPHIDGSSKHLLHLELQSPLLLGGHSLPEADRYRALATKVGTQLYEDVIRYFMRDDDALCEIYPQLLPSETIEDALVRIAEEVEQGVLRGARLFVLDDRFSFDDGGTFIDPALAVAKTHRVLRELVVEGLSARRSASVIVRTGAVRNLHDVMVLAGLGADAICPYLYMETAYEVDGWKGIENVYAALTKGVEKVLSTLGIHELRGYDRLFSAIGLSETIADLLEIRTFFGAGSGADLIFFADVARERALLLKQPKASVARPYQLWPRIWKSAGDVAGGTLSFEEYSAKLRELEIKQPISLRHVLDIVPQSNKPSPDTVDLSVGDHSLPFLISSMSFGSQSEIAFRSYAEAAKRLDMLSLNGEGGEIKDMLGKYAKHRGHQIASGRFGVNAELCNSVDLLEIKIGQGAKPGEGGHLPGSKVSVKVAAARNARQGTDLISPSNNHDIYSIEDLAQMIDELKTVNSRAKVSVKVPVVPGIGTIAVGIAKAGADIITLSGFDGGTGAARAHALKHVGLPVEIGVKLAHEALLDAGLRELVELWANGGMKNGYDVVKMVLLGANRVGFGTMAMVAVGCTSCRACHKDTCHVGIATQIETVEQATAHGLKAFVPREFDLAVANLERFFGGLAQEVRHVVAQLGATSLQALVGKSEYLQQARCHDRVDLHDLIQHHVAVTYQYKKIAVRPSSVSRQSITAQLGQQALTAMAAGSESLQFGADHVNSGERIIGGMLSGSVVRTEIRERKQGLTRASVGLLAGSVAGNGFAAYNATGIHLRVEGGAQDGVGKGALGGKVIILKGLNERGRRVNGSVGKGLAYGAQRGLFIVQGNADARAGIRLSGADLIIGGEVETPIDDSKGYLASRANVKGFAFEYMTGGRALVMGDPGPWICSGMTGGFVYLRIDFEMGLTPEVIRRRIAKGAKVSLTHLHPGGILDVQELLGHYQKELIRSGQQDAAEKLQPLMQSPDDHFMVIRPGAELTDQDIATE